MLIRKRWKREAAALGVAGVGTWLVVSTGLPLATLIALALIVSAPSLMLWGTVGYVARRALGEPPEEDDTEPPR